MAILAKPVNKTIVIKAEDTKKFIDQFNKNKVNSEFVNSCKKAGTLFGKRK